MGRTKDITKWGNRNPVWLTLLRNSHIQAKLCDPLCGAGTVGVVALNMNRNFIGIDIDKQAIETAKIRFLEVGGYEEKPVLKTKKG